VRDLEREHVPLCRAHGLGVILPWSPLAGGFLSGKYRRGEAPPERHPPRRNGSSATAAIDNERNWQHPRGRHRRRRRARRHALAGGLAWLLARPPSSVIFGARSVEQLDDNLASPPR
jgi:aryl-alcohol dehydrogenase-like predicted oxidoreductase